LARGWVLNYICVIFLAGVEETKVPTTLQLSVSRSASRVFWVQAKVGRLPLVVAVYYHMEPWFG
jgi:hypothetical protein